MMDQVLLLRLPRYMDSLTLHLVRQQTTALRRWQSQGLRWKRLRQSLRRRHAAGMWRCQAGAARPHGQRARAWSWVPRALRAALQPLVVYT